MMNPMLPESKQSAGVSENMRCGAAYMLLGCEMLLASLGCRMEGMSLQAIPSTHLAFDPDRASSTSVSQEPVMAEVPVPTSVVVDDTVAEPAVTAKPPVAITLQEVRHQITLAAQAGYAAEIKALLAHYGATKVSDVDPAHYQALLVKVENLIKEENHDG